MARVQTEAAQAIYEAAEVFVERALRTDDSLFTPGHPIWTLDAADDLRDRFVEHPDTSERSFTEKFKDQLAGAAPETIQLAAEIIYLYFLIDRDARGDTKRRLINEVLSWSPQPAAMPADLGKVLDGGIAATGTGFGTRRPDYLRFLIEFAVAWKSLTADEVAADLAEPWRFEALVHSVPAPGGWGQREALLHLAFPDVFEPIVSLQMKKQIIAGFPEAPGEATNLDRRLSEIRAYLTPKFGEGFTFYQQDVAARWRPAPEAGGSTEETSSTVWWVNQGSTYKAERKGGYLWAPQKNKAGNTEHHWTTMTQVRPGDVVVHYATPSIRALSIVMAAAVEAERPGELAGESWQRDGWLVSVAITDLREAAPLASLPEAARPLGRGPVNRVGGIKQGYLWEVPGDMAAALADFFAGQWPTDVAGKGKVAPREGGDVAQVDRHPIYAGIAAAGYSFPDWLVTDYLLSLATKPFALLSGISGTGKTKLAQLVAEYLAPSHEVTEAEGERPDPEPGSFVHTIGTATLNHGAIAVPIVDSELFPPLSEGKSIACRIEADGYEGDARFYPQGSWLPASNASIRMHKDAQHWLSSIAAQGDFLVVTPEGDGELLVKLRLIRAPRRTVTSASPRVAFISVRADWTDNRAMLGYYNPLSESYVPTELLRLLLRAAAHSEEAHFVILDEMNLAKVEYYFSDFLSAMESGTEIVLHDAGENVAAEVAGHLLPIPERVRVPRNLLFTGTVNVDETTFMFSPKVLDRANVIQFHSVDLKGYRKGAAGSADGFALPEETSLEELLRPEPAGRDDYVALDSASYECLESVNELLARHHLHFGYRVANEIARYLRLAHEVLGPAAVPRALDLQIQQKVLPKFVGNRAKLEAPLWELLEYLESGERAPETLTAVALEKVTGKGARYPESVLALAGMLRTLRQVGFASFIE